MNERYEQLLAQAYIEFAPGSKAVTKRFAELIVKECADVGERYANGNYEVYNQIMKHFGVEE